MRGFNFKKNNKRADTSMDPYVPQRIELPLYFNTPKRKDDLLNSRKYKMKSPEKPDLNDSYINHQSALNMSYADSADSVLSKKRLKDYALLAFACKRANKPRVIIIIVKYIG